MLRCRASGCWRSEAREAASYPTHVGNVTQGGTDLCLPAYGFQLPAYGRATPHPKILVRLVRLQHGNSSPFQMSGYAHGFEGIALQGMCCLAMHGGCDRALGGIDGRAYPLCIGLNIAQMHLSAARYVVNEATTGKVVDGQEGWGQQRCTGIQIGSPSHQLAANAWVLCAACICL